MNKLKQFFAGKYFYIFCPVFIIILIHFFSTPAYFALSPKCVPCLDCCNMQEKINRKDHLLESVSANYEASTHMAKTEFRLTIPFLAKIFSIKTKYGIYLLQLLAGFIFFFSLTFFLLKITNDKLITLLLTMSFGFIYPGYSFVAEMEGFFDSFAYLFLLIAMLDINIAFIGLALFFAFWTDERAVIASSLVLFWWQYKQNNETGKNFFIPTKQSYVFIFVLGAYLLIRYLLINYCHFKNQFSGAGFSVFTITINYFGIAFWQAFEGFWLLVSLALYFLIKTKKYNQLIIFLFLNTLIFFIAMMVADTSKSISYIFPSILISLYIITQNIDNKEIKKISYIVLLFCFLFPSYTFIAEKPPHPYNPVYMRIAKYLLHIN